MNVRLPVTLPGAVGENVTLTAHVAFPTMLVPQVLPTIANPALAVMLAKLSVALWRFVTLTVPASPTLSESLPFLSNPIVLCLAGDTRRSVAVRPVYRYCGKCSRSASAWNRGSERYGSNCGSNLKLGASASREATAPESH